MQASKTQPKHKSGTEMLNLPLMVRQQDRR
jgi:hypothetical protein